MKNLSIAIAALSLSCITSLVFAQNPVETNRPTADYKPAFVGQTRIAGVKTTTPLNIVVINNKLENPWSISPMPDGRFLITQKAGDMVILAADGKLIKKNYRIT
jgi:glucose/arabinose dehydrogenase